MFSKKVTVKPCACLFSIIYREYKCFFIILQHTHLSSKTKQPDFGNYFGHDSLIVFSNSLLGFFKNHLSQNANTRSVFFPFNNLFIFVALRTYQNPLVVFFFGYLFFTDSCSRSVNAPYYLYFLCKQREMSHLDQYLSTISNSVSLWVIKK